MASNMKDITPTHDKGVLKQIVTHGTGNKVPQGASVKGNTKHVEPLLNSPKMTKCPCHLGCAKSSTIFYEKVWQNPTL